LAVRQLKAVRELGLDRRETGRSLYTIALEKNKDLILVREDWRMGLVTNLIIVLIANYNITP